MNDIIRWMGEPAQINNLFWWWILISVVTLNISHDWMQHGKKK